MTYNPFTEEEASYVGELAVARTFDPKAQQMPGAPDCLLVDSRVADEVLAAIPGSYEDPNDPPTPWTRVLVPLVSGLLPSHSRRRL